MSDRRFKTHTPAFAHVKAISPDHPSAKLARTLYRKRVVPAAHPYRPLKSGDNQRKIGSHVTKGAWKGMPIYTLTLEERATCPRTCAHWLDCYGNKMNWSQRIAAGYDLERELIENVHFLSRRHPRGFVVRLHILGDFYSTDYVRLWLDLVSQFKPLHVYGYTARDPVNDPIGRMLDCASRFMWSRFAMRFSGHKLESRAAITHYVPPQGPVVNGAIVCPAQTGRADCCGTCGLCWQTTRNIAFLVH